MSAEKRVIPLQRLARVQQGIYCMRTDETPNVLSGAHLNKPLARLTLVSIQNDTDMLRFQSPARLH